MEVSETPRISVVDIEQALPSFLSSVNLATCAFPAQLDMLGINNISPAGS